MCRRDQTGRKLRKRKKSALESDIQLRNVADSLEGIFEEIADNKTNEPSVFAGKAGPVTNTSTFFLFKFHGDKPTQACSNGRSVWTTVLCDPKVGQGVFELPSTSPDGACDGCRFEILGRTPHACSACSEFDYRKVTSSCENGNKKTKYMWKEPRFCQGGVLLPEEIESKCSIFEQSVGSAMRDFKVHFKVGKDRGKKILKKIKDMASGGKKKEKVTFDDDDDEYFESVHLELGKDAFVGDFQ